jgi:hypothetical protein
MLYRNGMFAVIFATLIGFASSMLTAQGTATQYGHKPASDKGPRALALVQLSPTGKKARLIPIAVMMDGKFYDAGSYKAAPVPMALDFGVIYEAFRTGVSQGVFTITQPGQLNHVWIAEGTWLPTGAIDPNKHKKYATPRIADDDKDGPPVLHRRVEKADSDSGSDKDKKDQPKPATPSASPAPAPTGGAPTSPSTSTPPETAKPSPPEPAKASAPASDEQIADPNRPRLRRGKPDAAEHSEPFTTFDTLDGTPASPSSAGKADAAASASAASAPRIVTIPAISDASGPDPRPYTYAMKPEEEAGYRSKMLDLATQLSARVGAGAKDAAPKKSSSGKSGHKSSGKPPQAAFDDVSLHVFDLSSSNEPVLVLSAKTHPAAVPSAAGTSGNVEEPKEITLIARTNLEGDLVKLFFSQTDSRHLDVAPRMELIDAVDADGDGRGELLFRRTFDDGSTGYSIYRVTADGLWTLFEGTP